MKKRRYIKDKWKYWLKHIFFRNKSIKIGPDLVLESIYYDSPNRVCEFYATCKINDYATGELFISADNNGCLSFTGISIIIPKREFLLEIYVIEIISDLKKLINKLISINPLILTSRIIVNSTSISAVLSKTDYSFSFNRLIRKQLKLEGWIWDKDRGGFVEEYYFPDPLKSL